MRLDPKYFNLFLGICALITAIVIFFSTIMYVNNQKQTFREEIKKADLNEWSMNRFGSEDSVSMNQFEGSPALIHFWSTWSDLSMEINKTLHETKQQRPEIIIIAAATRDGDEMVKDYIREVNYNFVFVNGTQLYQDLMVPGLPAQLFLNAEGQVVDHLVGKDIEALDQKIKALMEGQQ